MIGNDPRTAARWATVWAVLLIANVSVGSAVVTCPESTWGYVFGAACFVGGWVAACGLSRNITYLERLASRKL